MTNTAQFFQFLKARNGGHLVNGMESARQEALEELRLRGWTFADAFAFVNAHLVGATPKGSILWDTPDAAAMAAGADGWTWGNGGQDGPVYYHPHLDHGGAIYQPWSTEDEAAHVTQYGEPSGCPEGTLVLRSYEDGGLRRCGGCPPRPGHQKYPWDDPCILHSEQYTLFWETDSGTSYGGVGGHIKAWIDRTGTILGWY